MNPIFIDTTRARSRLEELEQSATYYEQTGKPIEARQARVSIQVIKSMWGI